MPPALHVEVFSLHIDATLLCFYSHFVQTWVLFLLLRLWWLRNLQNPEPDAYYQGSDLHQPLFTPLCLFPTRKEWQLVTVGAPQYGSEPHTIVELRKEKHQGLPLSFIRSFLSLFKAENQSAVHTHAHDSLRFPSICLFSSQWSFRLDMYCGKLSCSASFFFSFIHSLFSFNCLSLMSSSYNMNRGGEESKEWGMNWWMGG